MNKTSIEWCDMSSNPLYVVDKVTGKRGWFCEKVSPGCAHCYASALNVRRGTGHAYIPANRNKVEWRLNERELEAILWRRKPTRIFMCDMTDLFHEDVPDAFIAAIFQTMAAAPEHTFQVLTKRPERMRQMLTLSPRLQLAAEGYWPLPNVWLGVSVENQRMANERIPVLLDTPAAVRFLSCEPLLGPLDLTPWLTAPSGLRYPYDMAVELGREEVLQREIDWVICGGESGPGSAARKLVERCGACIDGGCIGKPEKHGGPCYFCGCTGWRPKPQALEWVRSLRDQCVAAGTAFFFKQWPIPPSKSGGPALIDGKEWRQMPDA